MFTISFIMFLVGAGTAMGWVISVERIPVLLSEKLLSITDNKLLILLILNIILLVLGALMDSAPIKLMLVPMLIPIMNVMGIDEVHFGIIMTMNLVIGM